MAIPDRILCSSHTVSGVMPGDPAVTRHRFEDRIAACAQAGYGGMCLHFRDYRQLRAAGYDDGRLRDVLQGSRMTDVSLEFLTDWFLTGTEAEEIERVFDPFFTTKAEGMGVGLNICRKMVEFYGGTLWVEPGAGPGATFCFTLPTAAGAG